jgi:hypothetical protein
MPKPIHVDPHRIADWVEWRRSLVALVTAGVGLAELEAKEAGQ